MPTAQSEGQICQDENEDFANKKNTAGMSSKGGDTAGCCLNYSLTKDAHASCFLTTLTHPEFTTDGDFPRRSLHLRPQRRKSHLRPDQ